MLVTNAGYECWLRMLVAELGPRLLLRAGAAMASGFGVIEASTSREAMVYGAAYRLWVEIHFHPSEWDTKV